MPELPRLEKIIHLDFRLRAVTGLHIGGSESGIAIGGSDNPVIRDPLTKRPYIPGSSLKGKMRSLLERRHGLGQNQRIGQVFIHVCQEGDGAEAYARCPVCPLFGIPGHEGGWFHLTRLRFPDVPLSPESATALDRASLDMPFTEVKTEVAIDRTTSQASPRNIERVPAGAVFGRGRISLFLYEGDSAELLRTVSEGIQLVEADYLGGSGARGSGRVAFEDLSISILRLPKGGTPAAEALDGGYADSRSFEAALTDIIARAK